MNTKEDLLNVDLNNQKVALFIGSEENGLSNEIQNKLDLIVKINMNNTVESLNASVAAAIAMNHFFKKSS
jgi:23S rRNA (guanosine2251-2'-O)-methyltransferase